jgi:hypothetical protein
MGLQYHSYKITPEKPLIEASNPQEIYESARSLLIAVPNAARLREILQSTFISSVEKYNAPCRNHLGFEVYEERCSYATEPFVEQLFRVSPMAFINLAKLIRKQNDLNTQYAFLETIRLSDLNNLGLTRWNSGIKQNTLTAVAQLRNYANGYLIGTSKFACAIDLADRLSRIVNAGPRVHRAEGEQMAANAYGQGINNLLFKAVLLNTMHEADHIFKVHRGWKDFSHNLMFVLGLPIYVVLGTINYTCTGRFSLFNTKQTTTQNLIQNIQEAADFHSELKPLKVVR